MSLPNVAAAMDAHAGFGEEWHFNRPKADSKWVGDLWLMQMMGLGIGLKIEFPQISLPLLINWQHTGAKNDTVTALEPATSSPIGQAKCREPMAAWSYWNPGTKREYELKLSVLTGEQIQRI